MTYFHGTNADLNIGDQIVPGVELGISANHGRSEHVYMTWDGFANTQEECYPIALKEAYTWARTACMVAEDEEIEEYPQAFVYVVVPEGPVEADAACDESLGQEAVRTTYARIVGVVDPYELYDYRPRFGKDYLNL